MTIKQATKSIGRPVMVTAKTKAQTAEGICDALNRAIGLPAFEEENIANMVEYGAITICADGVIAWDDATTDIKEV